MKPLMYAAAALMVLLVGFGIAGAVEKFPFTSVEEARKSAEQIGNDKCDDSTEVQIIVAKHEGTYFKLFVTTDLWAATKADAAGMPVWLFFGTVAYGKLHLAKSEAFDPAKHTGACDDWLQEKGA